MSFGPHRCSFSGQQLFSSTESLDFNANSHEQQQQQPQMTSSSIDRQAAAAFLSDMDEYIRAVMQHEGNTG